MQYLMDLEIRNRVREVGGSKSEGGEGSVLYWMWRDKRVQVLSEPSVRVPAPLISVKAENKPRT